MAFLGLTYRGILTSGVNLGFGGITRRRSSYTPEAISYFSAVAAVGGTLTDGEKNLYNQLFLNLKGLGTVGSSDIFSKLDVLQVYHAPNESAAKIDLKSLSNILFTNTYTFTPYTGFKGDGSTGYINTTYNPTTYNANYKQNDAFYLIASKSVVNGRYIGGARRTGSDQSYLRAGNTGVAQEAKINDGVGSLNYGIYSGQYYNAVDRASSTGARAYRDGLLVDTNTAVSGARLNAIMIIPGFNNFPTTDDGIVPAVLNSTDYYNFFTAGASLTDSEHYQLYSALNKFKNDTITYNASQAYFSAVTASGGTLTDNVQAEFTSFVSREVEAGRWSKIKRLYPFLGGKINSAIIDAKTLNSAISVGFVDADADATIGLQGDGAGKYLNTDLGMNSIVISNYDWQMGYFILGNIPTLTALVRPMGYYRSTGTRGAIYLQIDTSKRPSAFGNWSSISTGSSASLVNNSSHFGARFSNTELIVMQDGVKKNTNVTADSDVRIDVPVTMFGFQINGVYQSFSPMNHSGYFIAEGMTEADLTAFDTSYKEFITNVQAYAALMDSYASAAAAYSLRKLYSSYTGSAINVRRSSDNATQDIGFDGYVLDTASLLSFVGAGSGYVTTWYDQSGNGNDATQTTASAQPTIVSSGSLITDGGKSVISFNGTSNYMLFARQPFESSFVTGKFAKTASAQRILFTGGSDTSTSFYQSSDVIYTTADSLNYQVGYNGSINGARTTTNFNAKDIITVTPSSVNTYSNIRFNGVNVESTTSNGAVGSTASNSIIGARGNGLGGSATQFLNAPLHEIILYNNSQEANQSEIESLINSYYGIY